MDPSREGVTPPPHPHTHSQGGKPGKFGGNYQIIEGGGGYPSFGGRSEKLGWIGKQWMTMRNTDFIAYFVTDFRWKKRILSLAAMDLVNKFLCKGTFYDKRAHWQRHTFELLMEHQWKTWPHKVLHLRTAHQALSTQGIRTCVLLRGWRYIL
jgi:hypothetical protein